MAGSKLKVEEIVCTDKKSLVKFVFDPGPRQHIFEVEFQDSDKQLGVDWKSKPLSHVVHRAIAKQALLLEDFLDALRHHEDCPGDLDQWVEGLKNEIVQKEGRQQDERR